jgi:hypothetical protein
LLAELDQTKAAAAVVQERAAAQEAELGGLQTEHHTALQQLVASERAQRAVRALIL